MTTIRPRPLQACLTLCLALSLAACGGGGGGGSAGSMPTPAGAPPGGTGTATPPPTTPTDTAPTTPTTPPPGTTPATPEPGTTPVACNSGDAPIVAATSFALINIVRTAAGLPEFVRHAPLDGTAQAHAQYTAINGSGGSDQEAGKPCYTGATVDQRMAAAGVVGLQQPGVRAYGESVLAYAAAADTTIPAWDIVNDALNNVYGRMVLLTPAAQQAGLGLSIQAQRRALVFDTALSAESLAAAGNRWVVWPRDGATGLPVRMLGANMKPLDDGVAEGYPITVHALQALQIDRFVLTTASDGAVVATTLVTAANDRNSFLGMGEAALVPNAPLQPGTQYRVELSATVGSETIYRSWSFTTAP